MRFPTYRSNGECFKSSLFFPIHLISDNSCRPIQKRVTVVKICTPISNAELSAATKVTMQQVSRSHAVWKMALLAWVDVLAKELHPRILASILKYQYFVTVVGFYNFMQSIRKCWMRCSLCNKCIFKCVSVSKTIFEWA